jgi:tetratricopeptide (TPR) repeat protein/CHAT domain-containing protein
MWGWLKGNGRRAEQQVVKPVVRSDAEYLRLLQDLLDRLAIDRSYATVVAWLVQRRVKEGDLAVWLRGAAEQLDENLRGRLELLVSLRRGDLSLVAEEVLGAAKATVQDFNSDDAEEWFDRGNSLFEEWLFEEAIESYDRAISFKHDYHQAWSNRGSALDSLGRYEEAIKSYERAISFKHDKHEAWFNRGSALDDLGRYEEAIESYERAISFKHDKHEAWFNRGVSLDNLGRYEEAIESYERAISFKHDLHEAWFNRGVSLANLGRYEEAIKSYNRAISFKHDKHEAWFSRGSALDDLGRYEEAIESYDRAISFKHDKHEAWSNRGSALDNLGRYEEAIESYDRAISFKHDKYEAWYNRGISLGNLGKYEEAIESYDRAISFKHDKHEAWYNQGISLDNLGKYEEAIENYQQGLSYLQPTPHPEGWGELHQGLGRLHYRKGQNNSDKFRLDSRVYYRQALAAFQEAETTLQQFPGLHLKLIQDFMKVYSALREPEQANSRREQGQELLKQLLNNKSPLQRRKLLAKFNSFRQLEVDVLLQNQQPILALEAAELCKNLCLESLLNALQENIVSPSFAQIQTLLQPHNAIIYWHLSPSALSTFILQPGDNEPTVFCSYDLVELQNWIAQWDKINTVASIPSTANVKKKSPNEELPLAFATLDWPKLQQILEIDKITQHLQQQPGITSLTLIPHKDLHRLPLHQFFSQPITYLPSLQIALNLRQKAPTDSAPIVDLIQPPQGSELSNADVEIIAIKALYPKGRVLTSSNTTKPKFLEFIGAVGRENTMKDPHPSPPQRILHFTGHSQHFARRPQESCLYLNNNETITCPDLATSNLTPYHLIILSACQTSIVNNQSLHDEYIGLVSACLSGGASYTISALWEVKDQASSPLFIYFYQQLAQNIPAPQALHNASQWLRYVTNAELSQFYTQLSQHPRLSHQDDILEKIRIIILALQEFKPTDRGASSEKNRPYQDPHYWAAFTISGTAPKPAD